MGTGASSASSRSPSPEYAQSQRNSLRNNMNNDDNRKNSMSGYNEKWRGQNVICNHVAPIVISKDCFEEYQCSFLNEKETQVMGAISHDMPEHSLVMEKYFMVADQFSDIDELSTMGKYSAPNFRKSHGGYPVYGMGQPTSDGLKRVMEFLENEKYSEILVVNIRAEPVIFVKQGGDYISYSPREKANLINNIVLSADVDEIAQQEVALRKEIRKHAMRSKNGCYFFYNNVEDLTDEPHEIPIDYEEDILTSSEVYSLHTVGMHNTFFSRIPLTSAKSSIEEAINELVTAVKDMPSLFYGKEALLPAIVFTGHMGAGRTTFAMSLGILIMAHQRGFPPDAYSESSCPTNKHIPNIELGEFWPVMRICTLLEDGFKRKREVDSVLDLCADVGNPREKIIECHHKLLEIQEDYQIAGKSAKKYYLECAMRHLERYCYLIIFNSYLHEQFRQFFCRSFTAWMRQHSELFLALAYLDTTERTASADLVTKGVRFLVADDYVGLDVLSSRREVCVSNFRKVPGLPVYGMAQPNSKALDKVCKYLMSTKHGHSSIHSFNLRGEQVIHCDSGTYTPRELAALDSNISLAAVNQKEIEKKELELKNELLKPNVSLQVYMDITEPRKTVEFSSIKTIREIYDEQIQQTPQLKYYRLVDLFRRSGPMEKTINKILCIVKDLDDIYTDEDGPALLFNCQTGKEQTTVAMATAGLIIWHKKGFPVGSKLGEQERISVPQAEYTKGEFSVVRKLVLRLPHGSQVKREVDLMLDKCSETMTPMHFHIREVIFSLFNKMKTAKEEEVELLHHQSLDNLERYLYLILFNAYLHMERSSNWELPFHHWMKTVGYKIGAYDLLDSLEFGELDINNQFETSTLRSRWSHHHDNSKIIRGHLV